MNTIKFRELFSFHAKTKIKAGEGLDEGKYPFYTSSPLLRKRLNEALFLNKAIIFGTGGSASVHFVDEPFSVSTDCLVTKLKSGNDVNTKFIYYFLYTNIHIIERGFKGAGLKHISKRYIETIDIPLPDIETQNKIVAILDKAKDLINKRERTIALYDELLKATFLDMFGNPMERPNKWNLDTIEKSIVKISAGTSYSGIENKKISSDELGVVKISSVTKGIFNPEEYKAIKTSAIKNKIIQPLKGDLLFSRANTIDYVGATCIVNNDYENLILPDKIWKIETNENVLKKIFLHYILQNKDVRKTFLGIATGSSASMLNISMNKFKNIIIPYPPIELQKKFEYIYYFTIKIRQKLANNKIETDTFFKSLSQKAFKGDLEFNTAVDLEVLLEKDYEFFVKNSDKKSIELLLQRLDKNELNDNTFYEQEEYNKAKSFVIELLKEDKIKQEYDKGKVKLSMK